MNALQKKLFFKSRQGQEARGYRHNPPVQLPPVELARGQHHRGTRLI